MKAMKIARTLPAELPSRFRRARRMVARTGDAAFELVVAQSFLVRLRGLAGLDADEIVPLLFPGSRSLHTFGMRAAIDVVWLEVEAGGARVMEVGEGVEPGGFAGAPRGSDRVGTVALELLAGDAAALGLRPGERLSLRDPTASADPDS
jgi:uncharacterized membrane protein (UPF0127 family)